MKFTDFAEFLELTTNDDRQFLGLDELHKIPETVYALANSSGGWIICGAELDECGEINIYGLDEDFDIKKFVDERIIDERISCELHDFGNVKVVRVEPAKFYVKPLIYGDKVYRRVEGVNLISSRRSISIMTSEAQEFSRDDFPVRTSKLNEKNINEFREAVITLHEDYKTFSRKEFLKRCGVYSGKFLTFAGALMFGEIMRVQARLKYFEINAELEARNIWSAYTKILPKLTARLSQKCAEDFRSAFINALLHSDYNISRRINIFITSNPPKVSIINPGTIRGITRNYRLAKMFELSGILYSRKTFTQHQDMLNFRLKTELKLEGRETLPEPVIL
ncbi:MAG: hypothetical protein IJU48_00595 [Synergistaceae bacterium]|nr:hypothetical protein [Synergistaceae bacterium]